MFGDSSNIYVSATRGYQPDDGRDDEGYRRTQHTWLVSIEPHKHYIPGLPRHKLELTHYYATHDDGTYTIQKHSTDGIIGTILVAEAAHTTAEKIREALEEGLKSTETSLPSEQTADGESDRWVRKGLHALQEHKIISTFDVGEFMTFAHAFIANRLDREAPAMIAYPRLHKDHTKKAQKHSFWLSYPMRSHSEKDAESRLYGGLM